MQEKSKNIFEDSKAGTIGARIRVLLQKTRKSVTELEENAGIGNGTLKTWKEKSIDFSSNVVKTFITNVGVNPNWWKTGEGEPFITSVQIPSDNHVKMKSAKETFYEEFFEQNKDYFVAPRAIFTDYKIVPDRILNVIIESKENEKKALEDAHKILIRDYERIIEGYENKIARMEKEKEDLLRQIPTKNK